MKVRISSAWFLGILSVLVSSLSVFAQSSLGSPPAPVQDKTRSAEPVASPATNQVSQSRPEIGTVTNTVSDSTDKPLAGHFASAWLTEVIKLAKAKVDDGIILTYIDSAGTFNLGAEQIIHLRDLGISNEIIAAIIEHDYEVLSGQKQVPASTVAGPQPALQLAISTTSGLGSTAPTVPPVQSVSAPSLSGGVASAESTPSDSVASDLLIPHKHCALMEQRESPPPPPGFSPVRQPYAVKLTDPILLIRAEFRVPNTVRIELFP